MKQHFSKKGIIKTVFWFLFPHGDRVERDPHHSLIVKNMIKTLVVSVFTKNNIMVNLPKCYETRRLLSLSDEMFLMTAEVLDIHTL